MIGRLRAEFDRDPIWCLVWATVVFCIFVPMSVL
jgi:hypothetical protein